MQPWFKNAYDAAKYSASAIAQHVPLQEIATRAESNVTSPAKLNRSHVMTLTLLLMAISLYHLVASIHWNKVCCDDNNFYPP